MTTPTCRTCHVNTLSIEERARFLSEPITMPVHQCDEHQRLFNNMLDSFNWDHVIIHGSKTGRMPRPPEFQRVSAP